MPQSNNALTPFDLLSSDILDALKQLLTMCGVPYVVAPFEAEAQCASLEEANLVDGVVTEDSDSLLFGCRNVVRNLFGPKPHLFTSSQIKSDLGLVREDMVKMAIFMGCDYTKGVSGIAAVNAVEVVSAWTDKSRVGDGLVRFKDWVDKRLGEIGQETKRNRQLEIIEEVLEEDEGIEEDRVQAQIGKRYIAQHRNYRYNWVFPANCPDFEIIEEFMTPKVDRSLEEFSWAEP